MIRNFLVHSSVWQGISGDILTGLAILCLVAAAGLIIAWSIENL